MAKPTFTTALYFVQGTKNIIKRNLLFILLIQGYSVSAKTEMAILNGKAGAKKTILKQDTLGLELPVKNLNVLYLENTNANPQVFKMLGEHDHKRIMLQFYLDAASGSVGLYAYPGKKVKGIRTKRGTFSPDDVQKLTISNQVAVQLKGQEIVLGGLQLEEDGVQYLKKNMVRPGARDNNEHRYFLFVPKPPEQKDGIYYLSYKVESSAVKPEAGVIGKTTDAVTSGKAPVAGQRKAVRSFEANPSPPRNSY